VNGEKEKKAFYTWGGNKGEWGRALSKGSFEERHVKEGMGK